MSNPGLDPTLLPAPPQPNVPEQGRGIDSLRRALTPKVEAAEAGGIDKIRRALSVGNAVLSGAVVEPVKPDTPEAPKTPEAPSKPEVGSYENGWGFFDEGESLQPKEYTITQNDDVLVDEMLLGIYHPELDSTVDRKLPLSPERQKIAGEGICRAIEAKWKLQAGFLKDIGQARNFLQDTVQRNPQFFANIAAIHYQNISMVPKNGKSLADHVATSGDFLHFGRPEHRASSTAPDKLDEIMRVYVHTPPEFNGHVAATLIRAVEEKLGRSLYLKVSDESTDTFGKGRVDNMIVYAQTHGEMAVIAETLRTLYKEHPEQFDPKADKTDRARETAIPGVSIAEEPIQDAGGMRESFNSSRDEILRAAKTRLLSRFLTSNPDLKKIHKLTDDDIKYSAAYKGEKILREEYAKLDKGQQERLHARLKVIYREEARRVGKAYHVSTKNFAMNERA